MHNYVNPQKEILLLLLSCVLCECADSTYFLQFCDKNSLNNQYIASFDNKIIWLKAVLAYIYVCSCFQEKYLGLVGGVKNKKKIDYLLFCVHNITILCFILTYIDSIWWTNHNFIL